MSKECKRCLLTESAREDVLKDIQEHLIKMPAHKKVDAKTYEKRLSLCQECEHLISGTCMKCGCYVEFRAAFVNQKCPDGKNKKW